MFYGVGVLCRILFSTVSYLNISCSISITSVGEERVNLPAIVYLQLCGSCSERFLCPLGAGIGCVILFWHSLSLLYSHPLTF